MDKIIMASVAVHAILSSAIPTRTFSAQEAIGLTVVAGDFALKVGIPFELAVSTMVSAIKDDEETLAKTLDKAKFAYSLFEEEYAKAE